MPTFYMRNKLMSVGVSSCRKPILDIKKRNVKQKLKKESFADKYQLLSSFGHFHV